MRNLNIYNETSQLKSVILGTAKQNGPIPKPEECYDPKSLEHVLAGSYPSEADMVAEMEGVVAVLEKYDVEVLRPKILENCNQIFARDIGFVIENKFIRSNILPDRDKEIHAIDPILARCNPDDIIELADEAHVEGGDVMPWNEYIFVGMYSGDDYPDFITARTNTDAVIALQELFPNKMVKAFELRKSNTDARNNALHLDCCFQPVGKDKAIIYKDGFLVEREYQFLIDLFGKENIFEITQEEMYNMFPNVFSISENVVISEKSFTRLNTWLCDNGFTVEEVHYSEIGKQGGLLRCSTLPLLRN